MVSETSPCKTCKHKDILTVFEPCWSCIDNIELAAHKPAVDYTHYEPVELENVGAFYSEEADFVD